MATKTSKEQAVFSKVFIGKGTQVKDFDLVRVTLKMEEAMQHIYEKDGIQYLTFEISRLKNADKFGRTHTCFLSVKE